MDTSLAHAHRDLVFHYVTTVRAARGVGSLEDRLAAAAAHLHVALEALDTARCLAPDCVDIAATLGDVLAATRMYADTEAEFRRALSIPNLSDPALHNTYERDLAFMAKLVEEAREGTRASYVRSSTVQRVLEAGKLLGAEEGSKRGKLVAKTFPNLVHTQYIQAVYMESWTCHLTDAYVEKSTTATNG